MLDKLGKSYSVKLFTLINKDLLPSDDRSQRGKAFIVTFLVLI